VSTNPGGSARQSWSIHVFQVHGRPSFKKPSSPLSKASRGSWTTLGIEISPLASLFGDIDKIIIKFGMKINYAIMGCRLKFTIALLSCK